LIHNLNLLIIKLLNLIHRVL